MTSAGKTRLAGVVLAAAAAIPLAACGGNPARAVEHPPERARPHVEVVTIGAAEVGGVRGNAVLAFKRESALSFPVAGEILAIKADVGDRVSVGQPLATLRRTTVGADRTESELIQQTAQQTYDRTKRLHDAGAASDADFEAARVALERARTQVILTAPADGVILARTAEPGQVANAGQAVFRLGETAPGVIANTTLSAAEAGAIQVGAAAKVHVKNRGDFVGAVARMAPASVQAFGVFQVEVRIDNPRDLRSGDVAEVFIETGSATPGAKALHVPVLALVDARADQGVVFVVDNEGLAHRRSVETEGVGPEGVLVVKGLDAGDRVITSGASMLRDGDPVDISQR